MMITLIATAGSIMMPFVMMLILALTSQNQNSCNCPYNNSGTDCCPLISIQTCTATAQKDCPSKY